MMNQRNRDGFRPIPEPDALEKLTLKNTSRPFDDRSALEHLREVDDELAKADARLIDAMFA